MAIEIEVLNYLKDLNHEKYNFVYYNLILSMNVMKVKSRTEQRDTAQHLALCFIRR